MNSYDVIIIGAGNAGLVAGLTLQKKGKRVLILESGRVPGGFASSFKRGQFEFDTSLHELCDYGDNDNQGEVYKLFERLNIKIPMKKLKDTFYAITLDTNEKYCMPTGKENFIKAMEMYVPGSESSIRDFFALCEEIKEALNYLRDSHGNPDPIIMHEKYSNFMVVAPYSLDKVLKKLNIPKKAIEILSTYWVYLGSPASDLSFVHYASMLYSYVTMQPVIPVLRSHQISLTLSEEFLNFGGKIKYLSPVTKIETENSEVKAVITKQNDVFECKHIISNISPNMVYGALMSPNEVPKKAKQLTNSRTLGARGICVYLGLNKSPQEIGLTKYTYFISHTLDSDTEYNRMKDVFSGNVVAVVLNNEIPDASPTGTTILTLTSLVFGNAFDKIVTKENYFEIKDKIADSLISSFEKATNTNIRECIEEIEVATPITFARYTGHPDGSIYGYMALKYDNLLPRMMNEEAENYIKGLRFCGGFASRLSGFSSTYLNGETIALQTLKELSE